MAGPEVKLTFAGDSDKLEKAFDRVGASSKEMATEVGSASDSVARDAGEGFDRAGEAADDLDTKAMGFRDTMTGVQDTMSGVGEIAKGNLFEGFFTLGMGIGDLASGFANFLIPAMKTSIKTGLTNAATAVKQTVANAAHKVSLIASTVATKAMTVAQRALNLVMRANPIGIVITALAALAAGIVIAWRKSETFRNIVRGAMSAVRDAFGWVLDKGAQVVGWFKSLPGKIGGFLSGVASTVTAPFRNAFNGIRNIWNSTVGGRGFTVPSWVPGIGGREFRIPTLHQGGIVPGAPGTESLALLQAGERVSRASQQPRTVKLVSDGSAFSDLILQTIRTAVRGEGGDVQIVLGTG